MTQYAVLRPVVLRTTQPTPWSVPAEPSYWHRVEFVRLGVASNMKHAKALFGGHPVLEELRKDPTWQ